MNVRAILAMKMLHVLIRLVHIIAIVIKVSQEMARTVKVRKLPNIKIELIRTCMFI